MDSPPASHFGYSTQQTPAPKLPAPGPGGENFIVEELLDFSNDDEAVANDATTLDNFANSTDESNVVTPVDSCNSSLSGNNNDVNYPVPVDIGSQFTSDLCVPYDDIAELEWLSNFVEESFSSEDLHKLQLISGMTSAMKAQPAEQAPEPILYYQADPPRPANGSSPMFSPEMSVPGKARSKRSRATPTKWASRLLGLSSLDRSESREPGSLVQPGQGAMVVIKPMKATSKKKSSGGGSGSSGSSGSGSGSDLPNGEVRRCLHCATDKTPQWRTGPLGSKTLCNACGVRYKSGRLVPEYRPASSPTFMLTKHSNSHRKVMELRRQKELQRQQQLQQQQQYQQQLLHHPTNNIMFDPTNTDDYLIHQHIGPDFRQII